MRKEFKYSLILIHLYHIIKTLEHSKIILRFTLGLKIDLPLLNVTHLNMYTFFYSSDSYPSFFKEQSRQIKHNLLSELEHQLKNSNLPIN
jgi:hypothetical protein